MCKRNLIFAILFIFGISLLNAVVLIEASNQEHQLTVDAFEQQPIPVYRGVIKEKNCNTDNGECDIPSATSCRFVNGDCR